MMDNQRKQCCANILASRKTDDQKLFDVFQQCKEELRNTNTDLYYALLGWADAHKHELISDAPGFVPDYFKSTF